MTAPWSMQCPHCDKDALWIEGAYVCSNGHESLDDEPLSFGPEPKPRPVTREEIVTFLDDNCSMTREEVHEAILAAWDLASSEETVGEKSAVIRFRAVTENR